MQYFRKVNKCHKYMCLCADVSIDIWSQAERSQMNIMIYHASRFFHKQIFLTQIIAKLLCPQTQTGHNFQQICQVLIRKLKVLMASSCNYNSVGGPPLWSMLFEVKKGLGEFFLFGMAFGCVSYFLQGQPAPCRLPLVSKLTNVT